MQISRHWRLKQQRYRLEGVRYANGNVNLQARPKSCQDQQDQESTSSVKQKNVEKEPIALPQ
ncbi:MAG: hypothetical protein D6737_09260 [Chloroflexi bacterium]|nr:MAG: hypothetical protein CUN54_03030 [Phototrophicales bacterium]RMF80089.1 MAG: hypothetical protein D6737_09260 [Chloroflexota bacterium]